MTAVKAVIFYFRDSVPLPSLEVISGAEYVRARGMGEVTDHCLQGLHCQTVPLGMWRITAFSASTAKRVPVGCGGSLASLLTDAAS